MPLIDYKLDTLKRGYDLSKTEDKRKYLSEAMKIVRTADSAAEQEELLKQLRDSTGITYESLSRDLNSLPATQAPKPQNTVIKKDTASVYLKASRFVIAAYLFGAKYAAGDVTLIPFESDVHVIISKYIKSKKLMEERVQPAELFEFFDEKTEEYEELCKILDYSDGEALSGEVAEKYFLDCILKLKLKNLDGQIAALTAQIEAKNGTDERHALALNLQKLIKQKEELKSGVKQ